MCSGNVLGTGDWVREGSVRARITGLGQNHEGHRCSYFFNQLFFKLIFIYFKPSTKQLPKGSRNGFHQQDTNPKRLVALETKFCAMMPNTSSTIVSVFPLTYWNVDHHTFTEQKTPDNSKIHRLPQNCGPSVWLLHVTFLLPTILKWFLYFWKICVSTVRTSAKVLGWWLFSTSVSDCLFSKFLLFSLPTGLLQFSTRGRALPWWQRPTWNISLNLKKSSNLFKEYETWILYTWVRASWIEFNNSPTRCDLFSLLHFCRQLYMFRLLTPIIRSWYSCNCSFCYWLTGSTTIPSRCWVGTQQRQRMVVDPVDQCQKL